MADARMVPAVEPGGTPGTYLSPNWAQATPPSHPSAEVFGRMVYDPIRKNIVYFGGLTQSNKTWIWAGGTWTEASPAHAPSGRVGHSMVWDPVRGTVVLFGGSGASGGSNDVWTWNGTDWAEVTTTGTAPVGRLTAAAAYDPVRKAMVIFGGQSGSGATFRNDTWTLSSTTNAWTQVQGNGASGAPAPRNLAEMAYSTSTSQLVLFGGQMSDTNSSNETFVLGSSASSWSAKNPTHKPPRRNSFGMVFDPGIDGIVIHGGITQDTAGGTTSYANDTWAWNGTDWLQAVGITSPPSNAAFAMAATETGQVFRFGGFLSGSQTWIYDTGLPLLDIAVDNASGGTTQNPIFYVGDSMKIKITATNTGVNPIQSSSGTSIVSALNETLLAAGTQFVWNSDTNNPLKLCDGTSTLCGQVQDLTATVANVAIAVGGTGVADLVATVAGTHRGCEIVDIPATVSSIFGGTEEVTQHATVCGGGLGIEDWWTYDTTDLGQGGTASVNVANGNLVVKQYDTPPVQTRGDLSLALGRAYNSQDLMTGSGPIGAGWQFDIGETSEFAGGFGIAGLNLPNLQTVLQPLSMPYIDRDGTRHIFKLRSVGAAVGDLSLPVDLTNGPAGVVDSLKKLLNFDTLGALLSTVQSGSYADLCIDQAYQAPAGTDLFLFRFIGTQSSGCANPNNSAVQIGWSLVRPDRVRYDFDIKGALIAVTDPTGQQLIYGDQVLGQSTNLLYGPSKIYPKACPWNASTAKACPHISIDYDPLALTVDRKVTVTDTAGRVTTYVVSPQVVNGLPAIPLLKQVWEPGNPVDTTGVNAVPSQSFTYSLKDKNCDGTTRAGATANQLCSVTDANGNTTSFAYGAAPLGPDRITKVTDRRGTVTTANFDGATKGLSTAYTWNDVADYVTADMSTPNEVANCAGSGSCQRVRYSDIDDGGRVGKVEEGAANDVYLRQTGYLWDRAATDTDPGLTCAQPGNRVDNNLCQVIKRAVPRAEAFAPGVTYTGTVLGVAVQDEATDYLYGDLGQLLREKKLLNAGTSSMTDWTTTNTAVTTHGTRDQYFDANGDQRAYDNRVAGNGLVTSTSAPSNYKAAVKADDPKGYYRFSETSGTTMKAEVGQDGTYTAAAQLGQPGAIGADPAIGEPPVGGYGGLVSNFSSFTPGTGATDSDFTVETWMNGDSNLEYATYWTPSTSGTGKSAATGRSLGGRPFVQLVSDAANGKKILVAATASVSDGSWHHVTFTYSGSGTAAGVKIYIDGQPSAIQVFNDTLNGAFSAPTISMTLGASGGTSKLDEVAVYDKVLTADRIRTHYRIATGNDRVEPDTLYGVTDEVQQLTPRGNASASNWGDYLTTIERDIPADGAKASTNKAADAAGICGDKARGNTGLICRNNTPASTGVSAGDGCTNPTSGAGAPTSGSYAYTCATYEYDATGLRTHMRTPKAHAEGKTEDFDYVYYDDVTACDSANNKKNCDLTGEVSAGGWLKAVTDPAGNSAVFAYDAAGNVARTWDRNGSKGHDLEEAWTDANAPPAAKFTDTNHATPVTSDALSVSSFGTVVVNGDGTVSGSGTNTTGELGDGTTTERSTPVQAKKLTNIVQVAQPSLGAFFGYRATYALTASGEVWVVGYTIPNPVKIAGLKDIIAISVGGAHLLALDGDGRVFAWGTGTSGQLGNGGNSSVTGTAVQVMQGGNPMDGVAAIGTGYASSYAVKTDGTVWAWGANSAGQLGDGTTSARTTPTQATALQGIRAVSGGFDAAYAIGRDGAVYSWGANAYGQLGNGTNTANPTPTRLTTLGQGTSAGRVRQVIGAVYGAAALMADGKVKAWGYNNVGQLGKSSPSVSTSPVDVPATSGSGSLSGQVALAGGWATWASADAAGKVTVWGATDADQRGDGNKPATSTPTADADGHYRLSPYRRPGEFVRGNRDATGNLTTATFDKLGNPRSTRPGRGNDVFTPAFDTATTYDAASRPVTSVTAEKRRFAKHVTVDYDKFGNPVRTTDARGLATVSVFDSVNRKISFQFTRPADQAPPACTVAATAADFTADQAGQRICGTLTLRDGVDREVYLSDANSQATKQFFDAAGRNTRTDTPRNDGTLTTLTSRQNFDADGNVVDACTPRETGSCDANSIYATHQTWDRAGRLAKTTRYRGSVSTDLVTSTVFDADGNPTSITDPNGHTVTATYDLQGRRQTLVRPRDADTTNTTSYKYDPSGNTTSISAPGSINTGTGKDGNLTIDGGTYNAANPFPIPDGAQYRDVTLTNGAVATAKNPQSGTANGVMFHATGTVTICSGCSITMAGKGRAGGAAGTNLLGGKGGDASDPKPGTGGLGGSGNLLSNGAGGGGGAHKVDGTAGQGTGTPGAGGLKAGAADFSDVGADYLVGSGGGGGGGGTGLLGTAGKGGNGGGFIRITASKIVVNGTVNASGANGTAGANNSGGGGGGAGGGIWLAAPTVELASTTVLNVTGGTGGVVSGKNGGDGSRGLVRIDADKITNPPAEYDRTRGATVTAYSFDAANRLLDTVEGAQTYQADAAIDHSGNATPDGAGFANTRTRNVYDADGRVAAVLPPQAFSDAASLTAPNVNTAQRVDYDLDGQTVAVYDPRFDSTTTSLSGGNEGGQAGLNQQVDQCKPGRKVDAVAGLADYGSTVGVCVQRTTFNEIGLPARRYLPQSTGGPTVLTDNRYLEYTYTPDGLVSLVTGPDPNGSGRVNVAATKYDGLGQPTAVTDALGNTDQTVYTADRLVKQTIGMGSGSNTHITTYGYDANGNQTSVQDPVGNTTTQAWTSDDLRSTITAPGSRVTTYGYDKVGNPTSVLMPAQQGSGRKVVNEFTFDNLIAATHTPINGSSYRSVRYGYSGFGLKTSTETARCTSGTVADCVPTNSAWHSAGAIRLTYGSNGRVADEIGRDNPTINTSISRTYSQDGSPKTIADPTSNITITTGFYLDGLPRTVDDGRNANTFAYDAAAQPTWRTDQTPASGVTAGTTVPTSYVYNEAGLATAMKSDVLGKTTSLGYDDTGRLTTRTTDGHTSSWSWNPDDTLAGAQADGGNTFTYTYDNNGDVKSLQASGSKSYTHTYDYSAARNLTSFGSTATSPAQNVSYDWDKNNNRTKVTSTSSVSGGTSKQVTDTDYNDDNSIHQVTTSTTFTPSSGSPTTMPPKVRSYDYDNVGRLTSDECTTYTYDDFDRTKSAHTKDDSTKCGTDEDRTATYSYDGLDRQRSTVVSDAGDANGTTSSIYNGTTTTLAGQTNAANVNHSFPDVLYQLGPDGVPMAVDQKSTSSGGKSYLDGDGAGNVTNLVSTGNGNDCAAIYDPFGGPLGLDPDPDPNQMCVNGGKDDTTGNALWYRGTARDGTTGNYQLGTRTYDPGTGAFTTPDTYRIATPNTDLSVGVDPLTANTYSYVNGNPVNLSDPTGHEPQCASEGYKCGKGGKDGISRSEIRQRHEAGIGGSSSSKSTRSGAGLSRAGKQFAGSLFGGLRNALIGFIASYTTDLIDLYTPSIPSFDPRLTPTGIGFVVETKEPPSASAWLRKITGADETSAEYKIAPFVPIPGPGFFENLGKEGLGIAVRRSGGAAPVLVGQTGEAAVREAFDIGPKATRVINGRTRIFDGLTDDAVSEVKNVKYQAYTQQLKDSLAWAQQNGRRFDLYIRGGENPTKLSGPLADAIRNGDIGLRRIP